MHCEEDDICGCLIQRTHFKHLGHLDLLSSNAMNHIPNLSNWCCLNASLPQAETCRLEPDKNLGQPHNFTGGETAESIPTKNSPEKVKLDDRSIWITFAENFSKSCELLLYQPISQVLLPPLRDIEISRYADRPFPPALCGTRVSKVTSSRWA